MNVKRAVENQIEMFNMLKQIKAKGRLSHAYLFYGEKGTGKKEMAYALACIIYCPNGGCLECDFCKTILDGNHMNVDYIGIENNKTAISKEQVLDLQDEFSKTSLVSGTRIYIVDGIDTATQAAQNSLLKFIEEPINQTPTIGIFLANEISNVVNTIRSRCILEHFSSISKEQEIEILMEEGLEELDAILLAIITNNPTEAIELSKDEGFVAIKELFLELIKLKTEKQAVMFFAKYVNIFQDYDRMNMLLSFVIQFIEDSLFYIDNPLLKPLLKDIKNYRNNHEEVLDKKLTEILTLQKQLRSNVLPKNIFHSLTIKFI